MKNSRLLPALLLLSLTTSTLAFVGGSVCAADPDLTPLKNWIRFQSSIDTLEAKFVQDRKLKTMRHPLRDEGTFWLDHPHYFRWQIDGDPPKMIAIRSKAQITVMQPGKNEAQQMVAGSGSQPALDFLAEGFPRDVDTLLKKFQVTSSEKDGDSWRVSLKPLDREAAKKMTQIVFVIDAAQSFLKGFELDLQDGSNVTTYFTRQEFNVKVDSALFVPNLEGYSVEKK